jgi:hypothetical protein
MHIYLKITIQLVNISTVLLAVIIEVTDRHIEIPICVSSPGNKQVMANSTTNPSLNIYLGDNL